MHDDRDPVAVILSRSRSEDAGERLAAIQDMAQWIDRPEVFTRLGAMLDDQIVNVMVDAAEVLARNGGRDGIRVILEEFGRHGDDADTDYIMYKLEDLEASGQLPILETARSFDPEKESAEFRIGLNDVEEYMGHHRPKL